MEEIKIDFENSDYRILIKPAGMDVVAVEKWLSQNYKNELPRQGLVHRLDKGTSGLLLAAKTLESLTYLKSLFAKRLIEKKYWAVVGGEISSQGTVEMPIGRSLRNFASFAVREDGKKAKTIFRRTGLMTYQGKKYSLVEIDLKTGRTHQIRVHFKYLGWPLLGDKQYGGEMILGLKRPWLHAVYLAFNDKDGEKREYRSEISTDLFDILEKMGYEKTEG